MRNATSPTAPPATTPSTTRLFRFGAWCAITVGVGHLAIMAIMVLAAPDPAAQRAVRVMRDVPVTLPGVHRDMAQLFYGFSVAMALLALAFGLLNLIVLRLAPDILARGRVLLWFNAAVVASMLVVSLLAFPLPPIVAMAAALIAYGWALATSRRRAPSAAPSVSGG